jgi:peroxiredoxin
MEALLSAGATAPDCELEDLAGTRVRLSALTAERPALLCVFKASCPTCQLTLPFLDRIGRGEKLRVVPVSQDEPDVTRAFLARFGITVPALLDRAGDGYAMSNAFGVAYVPSLFLVEPDGRVSFSSEGFSRRALLFLGERAGIAPFREGESVPEAKAG